MHFSPYPKSFGISCSSKRVLRKYLKHLNELYKIVDGELIFIGQDKISSSPRIREILATPLLPEKSLLEYSQVFWDSAINYFESLDARQNEVCHFIISSN